VSKGDRLIRTMEDLAAALRAKREDIDVACETIDEIAGLTHGHVARITAPIPTKGLGSKSLPAVLGALGVALMLVDDPDQIVRVRGRWTKRKRAPRGKTGQPG
jgi:hypothetical protein